MKIDTTHKQIYENLTLEKTKIESELKDIAIYSVETRSWEAMPTSQDDGPESDAVDLADRLEEYETRSEMVRTLEKRLNAVNSAIEKIESGTGFGICEVCNKQIEGDRLLANPSAKTCKEHMNNK
ncbi:MAG: TraR/DksA family transcriptional regulator [Minisyncoccia bacterium]